MLHRAPTYAVVGALVMAVVLLSGCDDGPWWCHGDGSCEGACSVFQSECLQKVKDLGEPTHLQAAFEKLDHVEQERRRKIVMAEGDETSQSVKFKKSAIAELRGGSWIFKVACALLALLGTAGLYLLKAAEMTVLTGSVKSIEETEGNTPQEDADAAAKKAADEQANAEAAARAKAEADAAPQRAADEKAKAEAEAKAKAEAAANRGADEKAKAEAAAKAKAEADAAAKKAAEEKAKAEAAAKSKAEADAVAKKAADEKAKATMKIGYIGSPQNLQQDANVKRIIVELFSKLASKAEVYVGPPNAPELADVESVQTQDMNQAALDLFDAIIVTSGGLGAEKEAKRFNTHTTLFIFDNPAREHGSSKWFDELLYTKKFDLTNFNIDQAKDDILNCKEPVQKVKRNSIKVKIERAEGLSAKNHFTSEQPYVVCEKVGSGPDSKAETPIGVDKDPAWNHELTLTKFKEGNNLRFTIWNKGITGKTFAKMHGTATLSAEQCKIGWKGALDMGVDGDRTNNTAQGNQSNADQGNGSNASSVKLYVEVWPAVPADGGLLSQKRMEEGWEATECEKTGVTYFYNHNTGETTWDFVNLHAVQVPGNPAGS